MEPPGRGSVPWFREQPRASCREDTAEHLTPMKEEVGPGRPLNLPHLDLAPSASGTVRTKSLLLERPSLCYGAQGDDCEGVMGTLGERNTATGSEVKSPPSPLSLVTLDQLLPLSGPLFPHPNKSPLLGRQAPATHLTQQSEAVAPHQATQTGQ